MTGQVDGQDHFLNGDEAFTALNARAGGDAGLPLAVPQLATVARLARRLAIPVARPLRIADVAVDLGCWVRAKPTPDGVTISLADVHEQPARPATTAGGPAIPPPGADWTWESDGALRLNRVDSTAAMRHGVDPGTVLGRSITGMFVLEADDGGAMPLLEGLAERRDFDGQRARLPDGTRVRLAGSARRDSAGGLIGYIGGVYEKADEGVDEESGADVFNLRLEDALRVPLSRIVAEADAMNAEIDGPLASHYVDYAADIASAGRHLLALVDDLADLNAIERPDFRVVAEEIDLADVARRAAGLLSVRAADTGVTIERPGSEVHLPAAGEFRRVLQILVNLVSNAVRYTPSGGAVVISVARQDGRATVTVSDRGKGIIPEDQRRVFDKFERVDPSEPGGSGLGLYIARRLARAMAGDLTVQSEPGQGAAFTLSLPAR